MLSESLRRPCFERGSGVWDFRPPPRDFSGRSRAGAAPVPSKDSV